MANENKSKAEHVRMGQDYELICNHCGQNYKPNLPIPINLLEALMAAFMRSHKRCKLNTNNSSK